MRQRQQMTAGQEMLDPVNLPHRVWSVRDSSRQGVGVGRQYQ